VSLQISNRAALGARHAAAALGRLQGPKFASAVLAHPPRTPSVAEYRRAKLYPLLEPPTALRASTVAATSMGADDARPGGGNHSERHGVTRRSRRTNRVSCKPPVDLRDNPNKNTGTPSRRSYPGGADRVRLCSKSLPKPNTGSHRQALGGKPAGKAARNEGGEKTPAPRPTTSA